MDGCTRAREILDRLGLPSHDLKLATRQGVANETWVSTTHVVRLTKDPEYLEDLYTESVAAPAAIAAGVPTPRLICMELPTHSVWERVDGVTLADATALADPRLFFERYGQMLRRIHSVPVPADPEGYLDEPWLIDPDALLERACREGVEACVRRQLEFAGASELDRFVHQDLHAENVMVGPDEMPHVLDWGDAGLGDPAVDFRFVPAQFLDYALTGYGTGDPSLRARALLHQWDQHFYARDNLRSYGPYGESNLPALIRESEAQ